MIIMCPFFDDIGALMKYEYTTECVFRIGKSFINLFSFFIINFCLFFSSFLCVCPWSKYYKLCCIRKNISTHISSKF